MNPHLLLRFSSSHLFSAPSLQVLGGSSILSSDRASQGKENTLDNYGSVLLVLCLVCVCLACVCVHFVFLPGILAVRSLCVCVCVCVSRFTLWKRTCVVCFIDLFASAHFCLHFSQTLLHAVSHTPQYASLLIFSHPAHVSSLFLSLFSATFHHTCIHTRPQSVG